MKRFDPKLPDNFRRGAVLIMLYPVRNQAYFPLIKRPEYPGVHSGQIAFPGGKMDETDIDVVDTALREAAEEVAIDRRKVEVIGKLSDLFIPASNFLVSPILGYSRELPEFIPEEREVERVIPTSVQTLILPQTKRRSQFDFGKGLRLDTPYFSIEDEIVWGATAMILGEFIQLLENGK
ncbi:CoA pyrophosphatase [Algoriphagus sp. CAU 1675]|uniref:NUDIX hydrolase n=1 Tax=Algoriphagus sp. CAU 1675 TaxID=3032597 RepID=UPI0023DB0603|nr:CoA pyrophosphatase [Algoriphagus sp. CAU 1675]MDF2158257.1 CoA pyrophosphatase [Algoriphagus sp. CAU 1675]